MPVGVAAELQPGAALVLEDGARTFGGALRAVLPELDPSALTATLLVDVDPPTAPLLFPHQVVHLRLEAREAVAGYWIPAAGLTRGTHGHRVAYALAPEDGAGSFGRVQARDVEVLATDGDRALVRGGLRAGDRIVAADPGRVVPGQRVESVE